MERDATEEALRNRRYAIFDINSKRDLIKLSLFIFYTLTFFEPIFQSVRGYIRKRDIAWFIHPLICYLFLIYYSKASVKQYIKIHT